jgi:hypothetical protein
MTRFPCPPFTRDEGSIVHCMPVDDHSEPRAVGGNNCDSHHVDARSRRRRRAAR